MAGDTANAPSIAVAARGPAQQRSLVIAFRANSWTKVRDREGRVLLSGMSNGGSVQTLSGVPPLEIVIGNAANVSLRYKGEPIDLVPHTRQNVARLTLQ